ncbi:hypothetical protein OSL73_02495 [Escherichia coli]|nr:hypothetical protein [Escherichia coli]
MSEINYQEGHETAGQAKPVAWRYRYVKKGVINAACDDHLTVN